MKSDNIIGVVGGVGPYAGLDLVRKIFDQTIAGYDQEHLPVILLSRSEKIEDRTAFLLGQSDRNPAHSIAEVLQQLQDAGATVAGIPCNTAHAPRIFDVVLEEMARLKLSIRLLHMIEETASHVEHHLKPLKTLGLLSTTGTAKSRVYHQVFERRGFQIALPSDEIQQTKVHASIYDPSYGIKAFSNPVTDRARQQLLEAIHSLRQQGAEAIILGCTEIPLALPEHSVDGTALIDPTMILSRALIREVNPKKLKPLAQK